MHTVRYTLTQKNIAVANNTVIGQTTTGLAKAGVIPLGGDGESIAVQVAPVGAALDEFILQGRVSPDSAWVNMKAAAGTWGTATGAMPVTTGDVAATADAGSNFFIYDVRGLDAVRFQGSSNTSVITTLTVYVAARMLS